MPQHKRKDETERPTAVLGMFAKGPRPGRVKTRLATSIGAERAAQLYDAFLRDLLPRLAAIRASRVLACAAAADHDFFLHLAGAQFELEVQRGDDLGERMENFFRDQFERGASRVILIGSDSPDLPLDRIERAITALDHDDVVLGPSHDGGYYLIGMRRLVDRAFRNIEWSSAAVFTQTVQRLRELRIGFAVLDAWYDVDLPEDLVRLNEQIMAARRAGQNLGIPHTAAALRKIIDP